MSNTTVDAIGAALAYYTTPTTTGSAVINASKLAQEDWDGFDILLGSTQTAAGFWEMLGKQLPSLGKSLPGGAALGYLALGKDIADISRSLMNEGTISTSEIYSATANLSTVISSMALASAAVAASPVMLGVAVGAAATAAILTVVSAAAKETIDVSLVMDGLKQDFQKLADALGNAYTEAVDALSNALSEASDFVGGLRDWAIDQLSEFLDWWDPLAINDDVNSNFISALEFIPRSDPLTLDIDGDGIETVSADTGIVFDFDGDGLKTGTGWIKGDDGFLVRDLDGNGSIDNGGELFGVDTVKRDGSKAKDGFDALRELDSNADGVFDAQDEHFANVRVWRDLNQDGVSQVDELKSLVESNIASINLTAHGKV